MLTQEDLTCTADFWDVVKEHMMKQPLLLSCSQCGKDLIFNAKIDNDLDISIEVDPCDCVKDG